MALSSRKSRRDVLKLTAYSTAGALLGAPAVRAQTKSLTMMHESSFVPPYDAFTMERSQPAMRPVVISMVNGAYAAGYLVAPTISTRIQQSVGFTPLFVATACCYGVAALLMLALYGSTKSQRIVR